MFRLRPSPALSPSPALLRPALAACARAPVRAPLRGYAAPARTKAPSGSMRGYWSKDRLRTNEAYPLSQELLPLLDPRAVTSEPITVRSPWKAGSQRLRGRAGENSYLRTQLVSPALCDDIFSYYGHSLERHRGCDILDINPGVGLWSQKLHDFLQPRSHVLLEPRPDKFADFLNPLVEAPGSRYKLISKNTNTLESYRELVEENVFPHQTRVDPNSPAEQKVNDTLLVTGSFNWDPRLPGHNFDSMAKQMLHHFAAAAWSNDLFHAYGRVRTLLWTQHDDIRPMLAESVSSFNKANCFLEMTHKLEFVVMSPHRERLTGRGAVGREPQYEIESVVRAMQRGREAGIELPKHRRELIHDLADEIEQVSGGSGASGSKFIMDYLSEKMKNGKEPSGLLTESLINHWRHGKELEAKYPDVPFAEMLTTRNHRFFQGVSNRDHPAKEEFHSYFVKRSSTSRNLRIKETVEKVADTGYEMYAAECKALDMPDGPEKTALLTKIESLEEAWNQGLSEQNKNYASAPVAEVDDRIALRAPPEPRLQWDRRTFEPLIAQPEEAWPVNRLCLVSMEPFTRPEGVTADWYEWMQDFVYGLYASPSDPVPVALDKMQHGARDIATRCPALRDPAKGGRMNLDQLRVRMLTQEMIAEMLEEYRVWPFKSPGSNHNRYFRYRAGGSSRANSRVTTEGL